MSANPETQSSASVIEPAAFTPSAAQSQSHLRRNIVLTILGLLGLIAAVVFWFLFTARSVTFVVAPEPGSVSVSGGPSFTLRGVYLLRSGDYQVSASAPGYQPFNETVQVGSKSNQVITLDLTPLPGLVSVHSEPQGADVYVDSIRIGSTPIIDYELPAGAVELGLQKARYQPGRLPLVVTGKQISQSESLTLAPDWANVSLSSTPPGAEISIDDVPTGIVTPGVVEVLTGEHELKLTLPGHETYRRRILAAAEVAMELPAVALNRADAQLAVAANPGGVGIVLDGSFRGQAPIELALKSGRSYQLRAFKAGYADVTRTLKFDSGERQTLDLQLRPLIGTVVVRTQPANARVLINGKAQSNGSDGVTTVKLATRPQRIEVQLDGYAGYRTTVTPKAGLSQELRIKLLTVAEARLAALKPTITAASGQQLVLLQPQQPFKLGASRREPGRRANEPMRDVTLTRLYYLASTEVTNAQYRAFSANHDTGSYEEQTLDKDEQPVASVTWIDAARYCNWLSKEDGLPPYYQLRQGKLLGINTNATGYRLPTEAEWGYAARQVEGAELPLRFPWGARLPPPDRHGNYADRSASHLVGRIIFGYNDNYMVSAPVGTYESNKVGLYDMGGNVAEWMNDFYEIPKASTQTDPGGPASGEFHVIKGAGWMHGTITDLRLSYRDYGTDGREDLGFRIARTAEEPR
ncbi:MAG: PEGA domain-containing protein [Pseudomonadales bacterium]